MPVDDNRSEVHIDNEKYFAIQDHNIQEEMLKNNSADNPDDNPDDRIKEFEAKAIMWVLLVESEDNDIWKLHDIMGHSNCIAMMLEFSAMLYINFLPC